MSGPATGSKLRHVDLPGPGDATLDTSPATPPPIADASAALPAHLEQLTNRARGYVEAASSANTRRAYAADWKHFSAWCRRQNLAPLPSDPQVVGLYITACASGTVGRGMKPNPVSTIERRLSAIGWKCAQRGMALDRKDRAIATVMADIRNKHAAPPRQKEALLPEDLIAMLERLDRGSLRERPGSALRSSPRVPSFAE